MNDDFPLFDSVQSALSASYPNHSFTTVLTEQVNLARGTAVGADAPNFTMEGTAGQMHNVSDYFGGYLLIDFWASWCRPCRMENPNVVKTYNEYKDVRFKNGDGFEVFSVSLDQNKTAWEAGIKQDGLVWENHVSDLQYWRNAAAQTYGVNSIPATYLIDGEGNIIKKNLRGQALRNTLEVLKK